MIDLILITDITESGSGLIHIHLQRADCGITREEKYMYWPEEDRRLSWVSVSRASPILLVQDIIYIQKCLRYFYQARPYIITRRPSELPLPSLCRSTPAQTNLNAFPLPCRYPKEVENSCYSVAAISPGLFL